MRLTIEKLRRTDEQLGCTKKAQPEHVLRIQVAPDFGEAEKRLEKRQYDLARDTENADSLVTKIPKNNNKVSDEQANETYSIRKKEKYFYHHLCFIPARRVALKEYSSAAVRSYPNMFFSQHQTETIVTRRNLMPWLNDVSAGRPLNRSSYLSYSML